MPQEIMRRSNKMRDVRKYKKSLAPRLRWTPQLHHLFIQSVQNLGGRNSKFVFYFFPIKTSQNRN